MVLYRRGCELALVHCRLAQVLRSPANKVSYYHQLMSRGLYFGQWVLAFPDSSALSRAPIKTPSKHLPLFWESGQRQNSASVRLSQIPMASRVAAAWPSILDMRKPLLPVVLETGEQSWISEDGRILPGVLNGPAGQPKVRGIEYSDQESIDELVAIWPSLSREIDSFLPKLVSEIHLDAPLGKWRTTGFGIPHESRNHADLGPSFRGAFWRQS